MKTWLRKRWVQMGLMLIVGLVIGWMVSELAFAASPDNTQREPQRIELLIPEGTAEKIKAGLPVPAIPGNMTFSEGDLLVVKNMDLVSHQLGPVWVPAQSSGVLQVGSESSYTYHCTFTHSQVFGLEVQPALTDWIRLQGIISVGLPTGVMLALFTLAIPQEKKDPEA
jgi:hypothetical protein